MTHLTTEINHDTICVRDDEDGLSIWWPSAEAQAEIETSDDPEAAALRICYEQPTRGTWRS